MPAWWRAKEKSKSRSKSISAVEEDEVPTLRPGRPAKKDKARSFDGTTTAAAGSGGGNSHDLSPVPAPFGHPLPRPGPRLSLPSLPQPGSVSASASASGSSSTSSSDETPDLGMYRYSEPRGRAGTPGMHSPVLVSPRRSDACSGTGQVNTSSEVNFNPRMKSVSPRSRGHPLAASPVHSRVFGGQDERNSPHPLPLPPSSPRASYLCSLQSQWKKGKLLGRGTFGHVYLGFNSDSGQMCAIKEVKVISDDSNSRESLKQLSQEITLLSQLSHPNIVQYHGSEMDEDTLSVYLEYVSGGSIHKLLQEYGPFREPVIRNYTAQILSGLAFLHGRNTVHRDIKGANILVDPTGIIKLADFGMAKHVSSYTSIRSFKGSPYWMAPEVIMNSAGYNLSVDIWSLGCTVLEMATSKPPWSQYEGVAAIFKIGNSKDIPEIPDHISSDGKHFLNLCLQRDPSARPTAAQLLDHPFVRDQAPIRSVKSGMNRDALPSTSDGSHTPSTTEFSSRRSISPLGDRGMRYTAGFPTSIKSASNLASMRMNISLPVSPCSSPLRQFRQSNRSCLPSPPHPAFSAGAISYSPSNYNLYPMRPISNHRDQWPDLIPLRVPSPYDSPRR